jgi:hypothetical protein
MTAKVTLQNLYNFISIYETWGCYGGICKTEVMFDTKPTNVSDEPAACAAMAEDGKVRFFGGVAIKLFFYCIFKNFLQSFFYCIFKNFRQ